MQINKWLLINRHIQAKYKIIDDIVCQHVEGSTYIVIEEETIKVFGETVDSDFIRRVLTE